jgi:hypothetical protein
MGEATKPVERPAWWRPPSGRAPPPPVALARAQAVTPERELRMMASMRSLAINFSFFSSLIRQC